MPEDREQRRRHRQATRRATRAIRSSVAELSPSQRKRLQATGFQQAPRIVSLAQASASSGIRTPTAFASTPRITFVQEHGRLFTTALKSTARHEVAHIIGGTKGGARGTPDPFAGHLTLRAAGSQESAVGLRSTPGIAKSPFGRQMTMAAQRRGRDVKKHIGRSLKPLTSIDSRLSPRGTQGFQTPHLQKVAETGTAAQQSRAREQMRRLGRRLKGRIDF